MLQTLKDLCPHITIYQSFGTKFVKIEVVLPSFTTLNVILTKKKSSYN